MIKFCEFGVNKRHFQDVGDGSGNVDVMILLHKGNTVVCHAILANSMLYLTAGLNSGSFESL